MKSKIHNTSPYFCYGFFWGVLCFCCVCFFFGLFFFGGFVVMLCLICLNLKISPRGYRCVCKCVFSLNRLDLKIAISMVLNLMFSHERFCPVSRINPVEQARESLGEKTSMCKVLLIYNKKDKKKVKSIPYGIYCKN